MDGAGGRGDSRCAAGVYASAEVHLVQHVWCVVESLPRGVTLVLPAVGACRSSIAAVLQRRAIREECVVERSGSDLVYIGLSSPASVGEQNIKREKKRFVAGVQIWRVSDLATKQRGQF